MNDAPAGPCILYAVSCGLKDGALVDQFGILAKTGGKAVPEPQEEPSEEDVGGGTGSTLKLKKWNQRKRQNMGYDPAVDSAKAQAAARQISSLPEEEKGESKRHRLVPLIDQIHRLMHLWREGEIVKVDEYLESRALLRNNAFHQLLQALIELSDAGSEERSILESISNYLKGRERRNINMASQFQNSPFCSISASGSNFNPRNTTCIPVVEIFAFSRLKSGIIDFKQN